MTLKFYLSCCKRKSYFSWNSFLEIPWCNTGCSTCYSAVILWGISNVKSIVTKVSRTSTMRRTFEEGSLSFKQTVRDSLCCCYKILVRLHFWEKNILKFRIWCLFKVSYQSIVLLSYYRFPKKQFKISSWKHIILPHAEKLEVIWPKQSYWTFFGCYICTKVQFHLCVDVKTALKSLVDQFNALQKFRWKSK